MKRISILILILASFSFGQVTSLSSPSGLARWAPGNKLNAGTIGDTSASNASLNYNFDRINAIVFRQMDGNGYFTTLYGAGLGNLIIEARGSHAYRIVLNDSVYSTYDWQTTGNIVTGGNVTVGGYVAVDSINVANDLWLTAGLGVAGTASFYGDLYANGNVVFGGIDMVLNALGGDSSIVKIYNNATSSEISLVTRSGTSGRFYYPDLSGNYATFATTDGNQNFSNVGTISSEAITVSGRVSADSMASDNNYTIIYSDTKIAGTGAGDTSANFTTFLNATNSDETKVRTTYVHRRGTGNIKAYYQIKGTASIAVRVKLNIYTLDGVLVTTVSETSTAAGSYASDVATLPVTALSSNTAYELRFITGGQDTGDEPEVKNLTIIATSN